MKKTPSSDSRGHGASFRLSTVRRSVRAPSALHSVRKSLPFSKLVMARTVTGPPFPSDLLADSDIEVPIRFFDYSVMGRRKRPYLPGMVFHLTARTQGREKWFDAPTMDCICEAMATVQQHTDAKLRAFVIMSNHLHLMLQQGRDPLAAFMQPLLTRVALTVRRRYDVEGHVFGRTYWDCACQDAEYLLTLVNYIHANP